jgi:phytoene dehydrogenase-like protein
MTRWIQPLLLRSFAATALALSVMIGCAPTSRIETPATDFDVIVIGAGLGGLSAATHLAVHNYKVLVIEQHDKVGGCATLFHRDEFVFDASLHAMAGGGPGKKDRGLNRLLKLWGIDQKVEFIELPEFYRVISGRADGAANLDITLPGNWEGFKAALKERWPEESEGIEKFHRICEGTYNDMLALKYMYRYGRMKAMATKAMAPFRQRMFLKYRNKTLQDVMDECFTDEDIKMAVSQLWVFYGAPVDQQTALIGLAATETYLSDGAWHIKGTSQALSDAYADRIEELGGIVKLNTLVSKVTMENGRATGVETDKGQTYTARYIVANTDPYQLTHRLIGRKHFPDKYIRRLENLKPANSLFGVYMGLNVDLAERGYQDTEIFYSRRKADSSVMHDAMMRGDFRDSMVAITIYSNMGDPIYAPSGKSVVTLTAYSDIAIWPEYGSAYDAFKTKKVDELVALAAEVIPELGDPARVWIKEGYTPRTLQRYTMNRDGVVYGFYLTPHTWEKVPNHTPVPNVFIASNWSQAWHGMGSAQVNGQRAAQLIIDREKR